MSLLELSAVNPDHLGERLVAIPLYQVIIQLQSQQCLFNA